ncbi:MAG: glycosyltransferase family 4 protein [Armatimonadota bacterium]
MKTTRILFIHQVGGWGGAGVMLTNIINALDRTRFTPVVVCPSGEVVHQLASMGVEVHVAPRPIYQFTHISGYQYPFFHPAFLRGALMQWHDATFWRDYIKESGAEIVHLNAVTLAPMAWSARAAGARVLCCVQETTVHGWLGLRTCWLRHLLSTLMDAVVFISEFDRHAADCRAPVVEVIPNWLNLAAFEPAFPASIVRRQFDIPLDGCVVLMMGGIDQLKGTLPLLHAIARLQEIPDVYLLLAGNCQPVSSGVTGWRQWRQVIHQWTGRSYWHRTMAFIQRKRLTERVRFAGMQANVAPLYAAADVVAFPATRPHQARPVLEAGAMKKPVVVTDFPQIREFVQDGVNGLLVRPGDTAGLASAFRRLLTDTVLAAQLGEANYRQTLAKHQRVVNAPRFQSIYEELIGGQVLD